MGSTPHWLLKPFSRPVLSGYSTKDAVQPFLHGCTIAPWLQVIYGRPIDSRGLAIVIHLRKREVEPGPSR